MGTPSTFPELRGNFTPVPDLLFDTLLKAALSREELVVTLFLVHRNYQFERTMTLIPLEAIIAGTDLDQVAALRGLRAALGRGTVLQFHTESSSTPANFYLLNTEENQRVMGPFLPDASASPGPLAEAAAQIAAAQEQPQRPAVAAPPPRIAPRAEPSPPPRPSPPPAAPGPERPVSGSSQRVALPPRALAKIAQAVGRELTKDERTRLEELGAPEAGLLNALGSLESRQVEIYSSDLVIYEYESKRSSERRAEEDSRRKAEADHGIDKKFDEELMRQAKGGSCVVTTWLGPWMVKDADIRVWLYAPSQARAERVAKRDGMGAEEAERHIADRDESNRHRYLEIYKIDIYDHSGFELVINSEKFLPQESAEIIIAAAKAKGFVKSETKAAKKGGAAAGKMGKGKSAPPARKGKRKK